MSYFDSQGDDSAKHSLDSLVLPPPPMSIYGDGPPFKQKFDLKDENAFEIINSNQLKTPDMFLSVQDIVDYYSFLQNINIIKDDNGNKFDYDKIMNGLSLSDQKWRLFISFQRLYEEYTKIFNKFRDNNKVNDRLEQSTSTEMAFIEIGCQTDLTKQSDQTNDCNSNLSLSMNNKKDSSTLNQRRSFLSSLRFTKCLGNNNCNDSKTIQKLIIVDNCSNNNLEVYERKNRKFKQITHQIYLNDTKKSLINIPIALELLIPKIQQKIEKIVNHCPFLCDPLEVVAELRNCNYDYKKCISYFEMTKSLRYFYANQPKSVEIPECTNDNHNSERQNYKNVSISNVSKSPNRDSSLTIIDEIIESKCFNSTTQTDNNKNALMIYVSIAKIIKSSKQIQNNLYNDINYLSTQLNKVFDSLKIHMITVINQCSEKLVTNEQKLKLLALARQNDELKLKLKDEEKKRRQVYNRMQEQMGNIRVYCRCRKLTNEENVLEYVGEDTLILLTGSNERFEFDRLFQPGVSQAELYDEFRPLVMSFIDGYNVCFITYGGEASGKTYTLIGENKDATQPGIMQRSLTTILKEERARQRDWDYRISACLVEIYNDSCIDVLSGEVGIQLYVDSGLETAYHKLKSVPITNEADADALIQVCTVKRKIARTALNPASSRSHLIILIRLEGTSKIHGESICSFLCLCDLAGFEDIIKAETQANKVLSKEAGYINRSLTAFNRVFVSLKKQDPNTVCYRDTKLTHLLKPFLTNSGKCALIVTVRNDKRSIGSSHNTLRFGKETRGVQLGKAKRQVNVNSNTNNLHSNNNNNNNNRNFIFS